MSGLSFTSKEFLYNQQSGKCFWCGLTLLDLSHLDKEDPLYPTVDHVIPKAVRLIPGQCREYVVACKNCNRVRGTYNTSFWQQKRRDLEKDVDKYKRKTGELYLKTVEQQKEIKRLTEIIISHVETPWWRKIWFLNKKSVSLLDSSKVSVIPPAAIAAEGCSVSTVSA